MCITDKKDRFLWGVATSAAQIEGGAREDGKGLNIWDVFAGKQGKIYNNESPEIACDSYHRFERDLEMLKFLGVNSYRFSLSWSRVLPEGIGQLNSKGVDYYKRCLEKLLEADITPNVTLYHWDLPQALEEKGGWVNRDSIDWFGEYAAKMFRELGDMVPMWSTINEPIATYVGYALGAFAPGYKNEKWGNQARHNILVAHGRGVEAFRAENREDSKIGVVIDIWKRHAITNSLEDLALVRDEDERNWKFYCDPIFAGRYSDYILEKLSQEGTLMEMHPHDFELTSQKLDYFGLNIYNRVPVSANQKAKRDFSQGGNFLNNKTEYYPQALYEAVALLHQLYHLDIPIYITENGTYHEGVEPVGVNGIIEDDDRIRYISGFLESMQKAISEGYDIRGYYLWSLMDNFEWTAGSNYKFGLCSLNRDTMELDPKKSAFFYKDHIRKNSVIV